MLFSKLKSLARFYFTFSVDRIIEAIAAIITVILIDVYVLGNEAIINTSTTIGAVAAPILQAVLLIVAILIAIGLLRSSGKGAK
jgi:hypothetical protein